MPVLAAVPQGGEKHIRFFQLYLKIHLTKQVYKNNKKNFLRSDTLSQYWPSIATNRRAEYLISGGAGLESRYLMNGFN